MRLLIMVTSCDRIPSSRKATGVSLDSFASGYFAARDAGLDVTVCSPLGGAAPIDPQSSSRRRADTPIAQRFNADRSAREVFFDALPLAEICPGDFTGAYVPDGLGALWDLADDADARRLMTHLHDAGHPCGLVGFGVAALLGLLAPDGRPLVVGRRLTGPTPAEARVAGLPEGTIQLDQSLCELGAHYIAGPNGVPHVEQDGLWITGQNAGSSDGVASALMLALS